MAQLQPFANLVNVMMGDEDEQVHVGMKTTPLDFLVLCRAPLSTIQAVYQMNPEALTSEVLRNACKFGASPGVVGFLTENIAAPELANRTGLDCDFEQPLAVLAMMEGPGAWRASEDEIMRLAQKEADQWVTDPDNFGNYDFVHSMSICFTRGYSANLICFLSRLISDGIERFTVEGRIGNLLPPYGNNGDYFRREVDDDGLAGLSVILPKIKGECYIRCQNWKEGVFEGCLDLLIENDAIHEIELVLPSHIIASSEKARRRILTLASRKKELTLRPGRERCGHDALFELFRSTSNLSYGNLCLEGFCLENEKALCGFPSNSSSRAGHSLSLIQMDFRTITSGVWNMAHCNIERLAIGTRSWGFGYLWRIPSNNLSLGLIEHAWGMPKLVSLSVEVGQRSTYEADSCLPTLAEVVPYLCKILNQGKLQYLHVCGNNECMRELNDGTLLPVLEALRENTSLKHFRFDGNEKHMFPKYIARLISLLEKKNTMLEHVVLSNRDIRIYRTTSIGPCEKGMGYYAALNRCGRRFAQSPDTTMNDFINMLGKIPLKLAEQSPFENIPYGWYPGFSISNVEYNIANIDVTTTIFELLQVSLDKWVSPNLLCQSPTRGVKRKIAP